VLAQVGNLKASARSAWLAKGLTHGSDPSVLRGHEHFDVVISLAVDNLNRDSCGKLETKEHLVELFLVLSLPGTFTRRGTGDNGGSWGVVSTATSTTAAATSASPSPGATTSGRGGERQRFQRHLHCLLLLHP